MQLYHQDNSQFPPGFGYVVNGYYGNGVRMALVRATLCLHGAARVGRCDVTLLELRPRLGSGGTPPATLLPVFEQNISTWQCPSDPTATLRWNEQHQWPSYVSLCADFVRRIPGVGSLKGTSAAEQFYRLPYKMAGGVRPELRGQHQRDHGRHVEHDHVIGTDGRSSDDDSRRAGPPSMGRFSWLTTVPTTVRRIFWITATQMTKALGPRPRAYWVGGCHRRVDIVYPDLTERAPGRGRLDPVRWQHAICQRHGRLTDVATSGHTSRR